MNTEDVDIRLLVDELRNRDNETEWIEFKTSNWDPAKVGARISALANSACRHGVPIGYMVWGIDDISHEIVGSKFYYRSARQGKEELENWLHHQIRERAHQARRPHDRAALHAIHPLLGVVNFPATFPNVRAIEKNRR